MDIGRDNGIIVDRGYEEGPYAFTGTVKRVIFDLKPNTHEEAKALQEAASMPTSRTEPQHDPQRHDNERRAQTESDVMNDEDVDELGPVDYIVVEFPADKANFSGEIAEQLSALTKSGQIRVLDLLFLKKNLDGSVEGFESHEFDDSEVGELRELEAELAMLLAEEDVEAIGAALEPDSYAAILVFENTWAAPFAAAVRRSGGQLVASGRIPIQALAAALEADQATTTEGG